MSKSPITQTSQIFTPFLTNHPLLGMDRCSVLSTHYTYIMHICIFLHLHLFIFIFACIFHSLFTMTKILIATWLSCSAPIWIINLLCINVKYNQTSHTDTNAKRLLKYNSYKDVGPKLNWIDVGFCLWHHSCSTQAHSASVTKGCWLVVFNPVHQRVFTSNELEFVLFVRLCEFSRGWIKRELSWILFDAFLKILLRISVSQQAYCTPERNGIECQISFTLRGNGVGGHSIYFV